MRSHALALAATFLLFLSSASSGCGSDDDGDGDASGAAGTGASTSASTGPSSGGGPGSGGTGNTGGDEPECEVTTVNGTGEELTLETVSATIVDLSGAPVVGSEVQLCGINKCLYGETDATGFAAVDGTGQSLDRPSFKFGEGYEYARFALPLDATSADLGELVTAKLPASGVEMSSGGEATSGPVTLAFADGAVIVIDDLIYDEPDEQTFRAAEVPVDKIDAAIKVPAGMIVVYGVGPLGTKFCPPAQVTVPNDSATPLAAGTEVEFWAHGVDVFEYSAPYGGWAKISDGKVSDDGMTISTVPEGGMSLLTTFGVKPK